MQKAYTTPHYIVFVLRFPGKTVALYIGRGNGHEGFYLSEKMPPAFLRIQDKFLDYARKYLVGCRLGKMSVIPTQFAFQFEFKREVGGNQFSFGYKDHQLLFARTEGDETYCSWDNSLVKTSNSLDLVARQCSSYSVKSDRIPVIADYLKNEEKKSSGLPVQKKKEKFLVRKLNNIENDYKHVLLWSQIESDLLADSLDLSAHELKIYGHKFKFPAQATHWQKRDYLFGKIKKLKKAQEILKSRLQETLNELAEVKAGHFEFEVTKEKAIPLLWASGISRKKAEHDYNVKYFKIKNMNGVIALDARSNDWIRSEASKNHWWFHIDQQIGSHLIIKEENIQFNQEEYSAIASILRDFSKLSITSIPLVYSQVKNLKGIKGSQGKVIINKPKYIQCPYVDWKAIITLPGP